MEYNHLNWADDRLLERGTELEALSRIPHAEPRKSEIQHELDCIAFEIGRRLVEATEAEEHHAAVL